MSSRIFLPVCLIAALVFLAYGNIPQNDFVIWDDQVFILKNQHIRALQGENLAWMFTEIKLDHWHPLTWLSHAVTYAFFELNPTAYHVGNVLLHSLNSVLFFFLALLLLKFAHSRETSAQHAFFRPALLWAAFLAAALYAVHPQRVEVVVWASARKDILNLFFVLGVFISYILYTAAARKHVKRYWYALSLLCFILALMSKTMAVTVPALLLVLDMYPLRRFSLNRQGLRTLKSLLWEKAPFFLLILVPIAITVWGQYLGGAMVSERSIGLEVRFLNAANSILQYLKQFALPVQLAPFYAYPEYKDFQERLPALLSLAAVLFISAAAFFAAYKKQQYHWLSAWLFYLIALSPVIGIVQVGLQASADRYTYLTTLPFYLLFGAACVSLYQKTGAAVKFALAGGLILLYGMNILLTHIQVTHWKDNFTFWHYAFEYQPNNLIVRSNYAEAYLRLGNYSEAAKHYEYCVETFGQLPAADHYNLGVVYNRQGRYKEALTIFSNILQYNLGVKEIQRSYVHASKAEAHLLLKQYPAALYELENALRKDPDNKFAKTLMEKLRAEKFIQQ